MSDALKLVGVTKSFGKVSVITGVDLSVVSGQRHALIGPNGAGKSTLFNLISGRQAPSGGRIDLFGKAITGQAPHLIRRRGLSRSFQITHLFGKLTVIETLEAALLWPSGVRYDLFRPIRRLEGLRAQARDLAEALGLERALDVRMNMLAYADQRALEIGVAVAGDAQVVLLDEPTAGMSRSETERIVALIRRVTEGRTLLMVEHDMGVVFGLADCISVLAGGRIIASGPPDAIRTDPAVQEAYLGSAEEALC